MPETFIYRERVAVEKQNNSEKSLGRYFVLDVNSQLISAK